MRKASNPYPWLDKDDPQRNMTDEEILYKYIDLSKSHLTGKEREEVMDLVATYKKAFSFRDERGKCPDIKVNIEVNDPSTFFVRPFPIAEEDKLLVDKCMQKLVSLGIFTKNSTTHTSPIMLVTRKRLFIVCPSPWKLKSSVAYSHILVALTSDMKCCLWDLP